VRTVRESCDERLVTVAPHCRVEWNTSCRTKEPGDVARCPHGLPVVHEVVPMNTKRSEKSAKNRSDGKTAKGKNAFGPKASGKSSGNGSSTNNRQAGTTKR